MTPTRPAVPALRATWLCQVLLLLLTAVAALPLPGAASAQSLSPQQRAEVVEVLREALKRDPTILRDAVAAMQQAQQQDRSVSQRGAIATHREALLHDVSDPVKGNPRGDVTIVEFFDVRCGYCKVLHPTMESLLRADSGVRLVLKDLPVLGAASVTASRALLAAQRQNKYLPLQDALMRLRGEPTEAVLQAEAERVGLDWARMQRDMADPATESRLQGNLDLARALSIEGTPALVIGDTLVPGAVDLATLRKLVAEARRKPG
ncbi:DsbA family protein [Teichococcus vastitatis]|uniref:DsbA family protein n=1 Tax=Teichococcus vastitatis TaxID=2307076 RepID=A0ABS9W557_9PROT|nr:DsbA family protein [Pseudoroseomonas vastitatis]MCI0754426.1 DsbA family protein [Pseudoroseomonas vastitatis]